MKNLRRLFSRDAAVVPSNVADQSPRDLAGGGTRPARRGRATAATRRAGRRLISESLEQRQLLASDLDFAALDGPDFQVAYAHNYHIAADVDSNYKVTALDALKVINALNESGGQTGITDFGQFNHMVDVDANNQLTALDALKVINALNQGAGEDTVMDIVSFGITPRTLDGDVQLLTVPDPQPDPIFGGPDRTNTIGFQTPRPDGPREANVNVGDVFKLEVQVQDLRGRSALGVFQVANDIIIDSKGVLEPVAAEVQTFIFPTSILDTPANEFDVNFSFADDPQTVVTRSRQLVFGQQFNQQIAAQIASAVNELRPDIDVEDDLQITFEQNNTDETFAVTVRYSGEALLNQDIPLLSIDPTDDAFDPEVRELNVRDSNGEFSDTALLASIELLTRNINPQSGQTRIYGADRIFGTFDDVSTEDAGVDITQVDVFNEIGAIGPVGDGCRFPDARRAGCLHHL